MMDTRVNRTTIVHLWDVEYVPGGGVLLREYPHGSGTRMSALAARELAQALLDAADNSEGSASDD